MLRQTSDWEGTLWGKPDWADRPGDKPEEWLSRKRNAPGSSYKYNDVRVNLLALNFFLNTDRKLYASVPASAFAHLGYGSNMIYVDPEHDLVVVTRWIDRGVEDAFLQKVVNAIRR